MIPTSEEEIDKALEEFYLEDAPMSSFNHVDTSYVENELEKAEAYRKELEFTKRLYQWVIYCFVWHLKKINTIKLLAVCLLFCRRQYNKVQDEVNVLTIKNQAKEVSIENTFQRAKKIDSTYEDVSKKLRNDLNLIGNTFHKLTEKVVLRTSL